MTGWEGPWNLVELGPGSGALMVDVLNVLNKLKSDNKLNVYLIEKSGQLIKQQKQIFEQQLLNKQISINWFDSIEDIPEGVFNFILNYLNLILKYFNLTIKYSNNHKVLNFLNFILTNNKSKINFVYFFIDCKKYFIFFKSSLQYLFQMNFLMLYPSTNLYEIKKNQIFGKKFIFN